MTGTIALGANHYETLGLRPGATEDQIRQAFSRHMAMFRPMAETARIGLAFETLRDPARRRAYDDTLGLNRAQAVTVPAALSLHLSARFEPPAAPRHDAERPSVAAPPTEAPEHTDAPFIAGGGDALEPDMERLIGRLEAIRKATSNSAVAQPRRPRFEVNPALAIGGVFAAAVVVGIWGGLHAGDGQEGAPTPASASVVLPPAKPMPKVVAAPAAEASLPFAAESQSAPRWAHAQSPRSRSLSRSSPVPVADASVVESAAPSSPAETDGAAAASPGADTIAEPTAPKASDAAMPLPNAVVARTIQRIGYSCGRVASTAAVDGEAGTFKVTCTSGQSYQAKPVGGRYRFRRLSGE